MFAKCQYLDEITGGKGVTFATGTPISNSMTELYTNMRYLQYGTLQKLGLGHFDAWAASFGETQTAIELAPEGTGYRAKTRFAKFFNLPELIALFKESADIQTCLLYTSGLCQKSLFVVPNHLTEQWASDFLRLYPGANILAATKKDFEPANRKKFCSRIATGDYDAVIIGHSQFEKIPLSQERQAATIERQIDEIELAIEQAKKDNGERYTIKQMEKSRKALQVRLDKLNDQRRKDNVVTFEQLGVDLSLIHI